MLKGGRTRTVPSGKSDVDLSQWSDKAEVAPSSAREVYVTIAVVSIGLMIQMAVSALLLGH